jgi:hypothetical protein
MNKTGVVLSQLGNCISCETTTLSQNLTKDYTTIKSVMKTIYDKLNDQASSGLTLH